MNLPHMWKVLRPGWLIPVFFLCQPEAPGQISGEECGVMALGGTYVTRQGACMAMHNQAGLGDMTNRSLSIQHARPFLIGDLGVSSLSFQWGVLHGALGATLSHAGIRGYSQTSAWFAYGISMTEQWTAGVGLHFWNQSIGENWFRHPGFSFAAGVRWQIHDRIRWGIHVAHPVGWASGLPGKYGLPMTIASGVCLLPGQGISLYLEVVSVTGHALQWRSGLEWELNQQILLQFGCQPAPLTISGGFSCQHHRWILQIAFAYGPENGTSPATGLTYAWE